MSLLKPKRTRGNTSRRQAGSTRPGRSTRPTRTTRPPRPPRRRLPRLPLGFGRLLAILLFTVVTATLGLYQVYSQYQVVRLGYVLDQDLFEHRARREVAKRLELSISAYKHPSLVTSYATDQLEMHQPTNNDEFVVPTPTDPRAGATPSAPPEEVRP